MMIYFTAKGHSVVHVVHETKSRNTGESKWSLCGNFYSNIKSTSAMAPTCHMCDGLDDPFTITPAMYRVLGDVAHGRQYSTRAAYGSLVARDLISSETGPTRRGQVFIDEILRGGFPVTAEDGVTHARRALMDTPECRFGSFQLFPDGITFERYRKLALTNRGLMITCLQCLRQQDLFYEDL